MKNLTFFIFTILICSCLTMKNFTAVLELTDANFDAFNKTNKFFFLEFYAPWCKHCKALEPIYKEAAFESLKQEIPCTYAKVDATKNKQLAKDFNIEEYPTVFLINNEEGNVTVFENPTDAKSFLKFSIKNLNLFKVNELESLNDLQKYNQTNSIENKILLIVLKDSKETKFDEMIKNLLSAAEENGYDQIFKIGYDKVKDKIKNNQNEEVYVFSLIYDSTHNYEFEQVNLNAENDLTRLLSHYKYKIYGEIVQDEIDSLIEKGEPTIIFFYTDTFAQSEDFNKTQSYMRDLAIKYRNEIHLTHSSVTSKMVSVLVDVLGIKHDQLPLLLLTNLNLKTSTNPESDELDKFKLENFNLSKATAEEFIQNWKMGKLINFLASEDIPTNSTDKFGLVKVVGKTFDEFMTTQGKDLVLVICSHLAKQCEKLEKRLRNVAAKLNLVDNKNLLVGVSDPNLNEYSVTIEPKIPSLFFIPADSDSLNVNDRFGNRMLYDGDFTTKSITKFIAQNSRFSINITKLENEELINQQEKNDKIESSLDYSEADLNIDDIIKEELSKKMGGVNGEDFNLNELIREARGAYDNQSDEDDEINLEGIDDEEKMFSDELIEENELANLNEVMNKEDL